MLIASCTEILRRISLEYKRFTETKRSHCHRSETKETGIHARGTRYFAPPAADARLRIYTVQETANSTAWNHISKLERRIPPPRTERKLLPLCHTHGSAPRRPMPFIGSNLQLLIGYTRRKHNYVISNHETSRDTLIMRVKAPTLRGAILIEIGQKPE